jgi:hypothetical protein
VVSALWRAGRYASICLCAQDGGSSNRTVAAALIDYNKILELLPPSSKEARDATGALRLLKPRLEAAQKEEVDEMLGKLKGLGNTVLGVYAKRRSIHLSISPPHTGKFGLSTDNFKFEPNGAGGYSMNFVR